MKKRNKLSLIALILGIIAVIFSISVLVESLGSASEGAEAIGAGIGALLVLPSVVALLVAVILNGIGYLLTHKTLTLISAIMYVVALILFPLWGFVGIPSMILQFIAFSQIKKAI